MCARTGDIGSFKLVSEGASASGIRRVEALTGPRPRPMSRPRRRPSLEAAALLRARPDELADRIRALIDERRALEDEVAELRRRIALGGGTGAARRRAGPETVKGIPFLAQALSGVSGKDLRALIDAHKARLGSGVILLVADTGERAAVAAGVTDDLTRGSRRSTSCGSRPRRWAARAAAAGPTWPRPAAPTPARRPRRSPRPVHSWRPEHAQSLHHRAHRRDRPRGIRPLHRRDPAALAAARRPVHRRGGRHEALEGTARARNVIIEFPDYASARAFYDSPGYRPILPHAFAGSERELVLVEGVEEEPR
jgi:hypothetical protein